MPVQAAASLAGRQAKGLRKRQLRAQLTLRPKRGGKEFRGMRCGGYIYKGIKEKRREGTLWRPLAHFARNAPSGTTCVGNVLESSVSCFDGNVKRFFKNFSKIFLLRKEKKESENGGFYSL
jgi:hypothetical protein